MTFPLQHFGPGNHDGPEADVWTDTPIGKPCDWCEEIFIAADRGVSVPRLNIVIAGREEDEETRAYYHFNCFLRSIIGSVAHLEGKCTCCGGSSHEPPGLTRRQAADAAVLLFHQKQKKQNEPT